MFERIIFISTFYDITNYHYTCPKHKTQDYPIRFVLNPGNLVLNSFWEQEYIYIFYHFSKSNKRK